MGATRCGNYDSAKEEGFVSKAVPLGLTEQDIEGFGELNIAGGGGGRRPDVLRCRNYKQALGKDCS